MVTFSMDLETATQQGLTFSASKWIHTKAYGAHFTKINTFLKKSHIYINASKHPLVSYSQVRQICGNRFRLPVTVQMVKEMTTMAARLLISVVQVCIFSLFSIPSEWVTDYSSTSRPYISENKELWSVRSTSTLTQEHILFVKRTCLFPLSHHKWL